MLVLPGFCPDTTIYIKDARMISAMEVYTGSEYNYITLYLTSGYLVTVKYECKEELLKLMEDSFSGV